MLLTSVGWPTLTTSPRAVRDEWGVGWRATEYATPFGRASTRKSVHILADNGAISRYRRPIRIGPSCIGKPNVWCATTGMSIGLSRHGDYDLRDRLGIAGAGEADDGSGHRPGLCAGDPRHPVSLSPGRREEARRDRRRCIWLATTLVHSKRWRFRQVVARHLQADVAEYFSTLKRINPDLKILYHSDGVINPIIPDMIEIGLDVLNPYNRPVWIRGAQETVRREAVLLGFHR